MERLDLDNPEGLDCSKILRLPNNQAELTMVISAEGRVIMMQSDLTLTAAATLSAYLQTYVFGMISGGHYSRPGDLAENPDKDNK